MWRFIVGAVVAIAIDRAILWDKERAVQQERSYNTKAIADLKNELYNTRLELGVYRRRERDQAPAPQKGALTYDNPDFEQQFLENGRATTRARRT